MNPDLLQPGHCVLNNLHQTARALGRVYAAALRPLGVRRGQFTILATLDPAGELSVQALADRLVMDRTTLSRHLKPLTAAGWVESVSCTGDRRRRFVRLTRDGRALYRRARRAWAQAQRSVLERYGDAAWLRLEVELRTLRAVGE